MDLQYVYQKKRTEFGRQCLFSDKGPDLIDNYPSNKECLSQYILRDPVNQSTQCGPIQAEHSLNTTRANYVNYGINHTEGGWPKDVNITDEEQVKRYRRKIEKEDAYVPTVLQLCKAMESNVLQNNAINIYQQYFSDVEPTPLVERSSARTVNVYQDQNPIHRPINRLSWSPDGGTKLAVTHCNLKFQEIGLNDSYHSYIWEVENPNRPLLVFKPSTPIVCMEYHTKDANSLMSGLYNGKVAIWDVRRGPDPVGVSLTDVSHREPVVCALWIYSKSGLEFFSSSPDGQVKWWDVRKLNQNLENLILSSPGQVIEKSVGASSLEYEATIPTRFMVGTEKGILISCNRKGKSPSEKMGLKFQAHMGPVLGIQRNPAFLKNFLTVGDWTARIWSEDCKESSIMWTSCHKSLCTFFTTRSDGTLDVWDILQQQKQAVLGVKVCDEPLCCIRAHEGGRLIAVGNEKGTTNLVQVSENLSTCTKLEKSLVTAMFEREAKREKILEARNREIRLKMKTKSAQALAAESAVEIEKTEVSQDGLLSDPNVIQAEEEFFEIVACELRGQKPKAKTVAAD
ncbi:hypothetical protein RN001_014839 [Aquatica leii]|uniref:Dynein intermediate chain 3, ciliary n=1 Tax=Aquatica leii TaxID=1421715 RepID=A0AAN7PYV3_9COLE|nr:hypothetical protein RN001_014839 [Aquatica leii]